ncbi:MAG: glycosyltransferase family 39 protein [bacterium]|nr:glycosyltransferase family 39 protein [bacterium]
MELSKNQKLILAAVLLGVFICGLAYSFYFRIPPAVDARAYDSIARNIVAGNGYRGSLEGPLDQDNSIMRVGPGYEFFLAAIYFIIGYSYEVIWVIQAFLLALSALLVFGVSRQVFKDNWSFSAGIVAAVLIGFSPDLITMQGMLMTETLGVFLITLSAYLFFRYFNSQRRSWPIILLLGLAMGAAGSVRTPALFLFLPILFYCFRAKQWNHGLLVLCGAAIIFTPWIIRNYIVFNAFVPTNLAYGVDLLAGNHLGATGELEPYPLADQYLEQYGLVAGSRQLTKETLKFMAFHPLEFLKITFYRISIYFSFARPTGFWFHLHGLSRGLTLALSAIYSAILFILGFWGILKIKNLAGADKTRAQFLTALLIMMPLAVVGIIVETRYRMLVYPFFAVFAGYGLRELLSGRLAWKSALYVSLFLILNTIFDAWRNLERVLERISNL